MNTTTERPASQKQFDFLKRLIAEKQLDEPAEVVIARYREKAVQGTLTSREASSLIDALLQYPRKEAEQGSTTEPEAGVYSNIDSVGAADATFYRVYLGQRSGRMLAQEIIHHSDGALAEDQYLVMEYRGAATRFVTEGFRRLSLEEVGRWGKTTNHCLMCGRRLDDPESVDRGIGPVCAKRYDVADEGDYSTTPEYTAAVQQAEREDDERAYASKPDACTPGQQCTDILNLCSRHQMQYQNRYGRASNE